MNFYEQLFCRGKTTGEGMTHFERLFAAKFGGSPAPEVREYTGAVPVTITADGTPLIDYLISGNTTQSGTPTPENPVMPQGCGNKTANLFSEPLTNGYTLNGTTGLPSTYDKRCATLNPIDVSGLQKVTISFSATLSRTRVIYSLFDNSTLIRRVTTISSGTSIDVSDGNKLYICFYDPGDSETITKNDVTDIMLNSGSTALPYEPYGVKIPISSGGTTTPVYLGEVETTRKIRKRTFNGTEYWTINMPSSNNCYFALSESFVPAIRTENEICSHLPYKLISATTTDVGFSIITDGSQIRMRLENASSMTLESFKQWLSDQYAAGTPVTVWYVLASETTGIVNEPLMRIGDYADTLSKAQAGVNIPTNNGSTTVDVDTTLKPSEVYIKYMG